MTSFKIFKIKTWTLREPRTHAVPLIPTHASIGPPPKANEILPADQTTPFTTKILATDTGKHKTTTVLDVPAHTAVMPKTNKTILLWCLRSTTCTFGAVTSALGPRSPFPKMITLFPQTPFTPRMTTEALATTHGPGLVTTTGHANLK